jgi:hypothetical protein
LICFHSFPDPISNGILCKLVMLIIMHRLSLYSKINNYTKISSCLLITEVQYEKHSESENIF